MDIRVLEERIDELIGLCDELERRRAGLEAEREKWFRERASLLRRHEAARTRVKDMIARLKLLERR